MKNIWVLKIGRFVLEICYWGEINNCNYDIKSSKGEFFCKNCNVKFISIFGDLSKLFIFFDGGMRCFVFWYCEEL